MLRRFGITKSTILSVVVMLTGLFEYLSTDPLIATYPKVSAAILTGLGILMAITRAFTYGPLTMPPDKAKRILKGDK
jgi:hypothetical protein